MPTLNAINIRSSDYLCFRDDLPWFATAANHKGLTRGGIYLLSGQPGAGKSTLALQMSVDLAAAGRRVLYVSLEMNQQALKQWVEQRIFPHRDHGTRSEAGERMGWKDGLLKASQRRSASVNDAAALQNFSVDSTVSGMEQLPDFLFRQVLGERVQYSGTDLIIVDSLQGLGTAPTSSRSYQKLYDFNRYVKDRGLTAILIGHITKGGAIAGPRSLEHNVDCVLYLRKAMGLRPLFVPKNRFGSERHEPLTLVLDEYGCLVESKHSNARASRAFGYLPNSPEPIELQALVKLPKFGERSGIKAPYLPKAKIIQLVGIASRLRDMDISDLTFEINCAVPGGRHYFVTLDLALVVCMLSSYLQREIPPGSMFVGEVDLTQEIRGISQSDCEAIATNLAQESAAVGSRSISHIFVSEESRDALALALARTGSRVNVKGVRSLDSLVSEIWPDAIESANFQQHAWEANGRSAGSLAGI
jgi:DNA repair protein RadA/Sms